MSDPSELKDQKQALSVLVQAVVKAQAAGAFTLKEAALLNKAVDMFSEKQESADNGEGSSKGKGKEA